MADPSANSGPEEFANFDAFFAERKAKSTARGARCRLFGVDYELPVQVPLAYTMLSAKNATRDDLEALSDVLTPLFGKDVLDFWVSQGMGHEDFEIVLAWAAQNMAAPGSMTMAQAAEAVAAAEAEQAGKAPANREQRRAAKKTAAKPRKRTSGARS